MVTGRGGHPWLPPGRHELYFMGPAPDRHGQRLPGTAILPMTRAGRVADASERRGRPAREGFDVVAEAGLRPASEGL